MNTHNAGRILVVDDNETNRYMLQSLLPSKGYAVSVVADGAQALEALKQDKYDLIISDILMPVMDGFQLCREIKCIPEYRNIPFIFYTATYTSMADQQFALKLGADRFVIKPQEPEVLLNIIQEALEELRTDPVPEFTPASEDEQTYLKEYNQRLIHKLEHKMLQLELEKERYRATIASISDSIITTDKQFFITYLNPAAEQLTGWRMEQATGKLLNEIFSLTRESTGAKQLDLLHDYLLQNRYQDIPAGPYTLTRLDGSEATVDVVAAPLINVRKLADGLIVTLCDITEKRRLVHQLSYQATHDALTGIINRYEFERRLQRVLKDHETPNQHALLFTDLDQFKVINDTSGHLAGDELLKQIARRISTVVRKRDTLARLGGDEFGILLEQCTPEHALRVAGDILQTVKDYRFSWNGNNYVIGISIGVVSIPMTGVNLTEIMSAADAACYAAKARGRNRVHVYQPDDLELLARRGEMQWLPRIHQALADDRFKLYCQPIRALQASPAPARLYEILLRMVDQDGQLVLPDTFIPAAERYDQAHAIDRWVVLNVFRHLHSNVSATEDICFTINLSGQSIVSHDFLVFVVNCLKEYKIVPQQICFEITETAAIADLPSAIRFINTVKNHGCRFALDDFGNGLLSFNHLKLLPVDLLKIDGHFVKRIMDDPVDRTVVETLHRIGQVLGLKTVAEWVESPEAIDVLRSMGIDYAQGFAIASPAPITESRN